MAAMASSAPTAAKPVALLPAPICRCGGGGLRSTLLALMPPAAAAAASRFRVSASASDVPDFLSSDWSVSPFHLVLSCFFLPSLLVRCKLRRLFMWTIEPTCDYIGEKLGSVVRQAVQMDYPEFRMRYGLTHIWRIPLPSCSLFQYFSICATVP